MHVANFRENIYTPPPSGQLSWALDAGIVAAATFAIFVTVIPAGLWVHRSLNPAQPQVFSTSGDPDTAEARAGATGAPLLWRVSEGKATVWLFGGAPSHHRDLGWMDRRLFLAFDDADQVWLDAVPPAPVDGDLKAERGSDVVLSQRAAVLDKPVTALHAYAPENEDVVATTLWRAGDEHGLLARASYTGSLGNGQDLAKIETALQGDKTVFVAVDITQLIGPNGILAQLRRTGHKVERLDP